jgi:hypothetical protein
MISFHAVEITSQSNCLPRLSLITVLDNMVEEKVGAETG